MLFGGDFSCAELEVGLSQSGAHLVHVGLLLLLGNAFTCRNAWISVFPIVPEGEAPVPRVLPFSRIKAILDVALDAGRAFGDSVLFLILIVIVVRIRDNVSAALLDDEEVLTAALVLSQIVAVAVAVGSSIPGRNLADRVGCCHQVRVQSILGRGMDAARFRTLGRIDDQVAAGGQLPWCIPAKYLSPPFSKGLFPSFSRIITQAVIQGHQKTT